MYVNSSNITLPSDETIIWKYLDLSKFLDMLLSKQLFMSRSDKFEDQYEGTFSEPTFEEIRKISEENLNIQIGELEKIDEQIKFLKSKNKKDILNELFQRF